jgi:cation diffusion facilitator CzcD-associated flavoprotein CzcO
MAPEHFNVLIVGAGLSGIGAAHHLKAKCPDKSFAILEARSAIGGTWDLFRYPGIRSDSDMFTLGYRFRPWRAAKAIADGPSIRQYVVDTARAEGIDRAIRFNTRVAEIAWSSDEARWTVAAVTSGPAGAQTVRYTCDFLWMCSGYYRYSAGYEPAFPGSQQFRGKIIHPQRWPEDLDYAGKRVVVIGSGATAVTLIPSMTDQAAHVVMLQRSPSWIFSLPGTSPLAKFLGRFLPAMLVYRIMRLQRIVMQVLIYRRARAQPKKTGEKLLAEARARLPRGFDVETHFRPRYNPWEQRLCLVPDDDLFKAISAGKASVETAEIETFTERGIRLKNGRELAADIIVTATGLHIELLGGASVRVDGRLVDIGDTLTYRGFAFSDVPNLVSVFGYLNASWTLRADLISDYTCRLLRFMEAHGYAIATPVNDDREMRREPFADFSSGYLMRAADRLPKQGRSPWRHAQNFVADFFWMRWGRLDDGVMRFSKAASRAPLPMQQAPIPAAAE